MYVFMHKYFLIGNFYFELIYPDILTLPEHFMLFETDRRHIPADTVINFLYPAIFRHLKASALSGALI